MKSSTKLLAFAGTLAVGLSAQAQATFTKSENSFPETHRTGAYIGDFTNNDKLDVFYRGQYSPLFEKPGIWSWTSQATFLFNQGNDEWNIDGLTAVQNEDPELDDNGDPKVDENGEIIYNWHLEGNKHGVRCGGYDQSAAIDYNNDGLLDLIVFGEDGSDDWFCPQELKVNHLSIYRNNGDGTFTLEENAQFPICKPQKSFKSNSIAVGDYDRDGYADFMISGYQTDGWDENVITGPNLAVLYHNNGDGSFTRMDIAETKEGVYTWAVKDEDGNVVVPAEKLEGWFKPIAGNVFFADLNNDGWLYIINTGVSGEYANWWTNNKLDGVNDRDNDCAVYLNQNGEKFVEITPELMYTLRNGSGAVNDFDGDGYLDFFHIGWGDNGYNWNAFLYTNNATDEVFDLASDASELGVWGDEDKRIIVRDFNNDGNLDILYANKDNKISICYGSVSGTFNGVQHEEYVTPNIAAGGDLNGDGLTDLYYSGDWGDEWFKGVIYYNTSDATAEAPAAPENVAVEYADGKLTITWDEVDGAAENHLAYNVYAKSADGKIYCVLPANPETGFIKVTNEKPAAIRPGVNTYSISVPEGEYTVGVQTLSLANETYSQFTTAATDGLSAIAADKAAFSVKADAEGVMVAGDGEAVKVVNALGQTVAEGVAGEKIAVAANGVLVVVKGNETVKIVK